jgi:hypothetical protein
MTRQLPKSLNAATNSNLEATWRSGYATVCKTVYPGSIPGVASKTSSKNAKPAAPDPDFRPSPIVGFARPPCCRRAGGESFLVPRGWLREA